MMRGISGKVTSGYDGNPIPGAHIYLMLKDGNDLIQLGQGTTTDEDGNYSITFVPSPTDSKVIRITHIAHEPAMIYPHLVEPGDTRDVVMQYKSYGLSEATVTAYQIRNGSSAWLFLFVIFAILAFIYVGNGGLETA